MKGLQTFSLAELKLLHKLDCSVHNASLETKEFALYSVLVILLEMYANSFTVFEDPDHWVFVHATPQDTLTGLARVRLGAGRVPFQAIPDMTVCITRLYQNQEKKSHHLVLTMEAKRLAGTHKSMCSIYNSGLHLALINIFIEHSSEDSKYRATKNTSLNSCSKHFQHGQSPTSKNAIMLESLLDHISLSWPLTIHQAVAQIIQNQLLPYPPVSTQKIAT